MRRRCTHKSKLKHEDKEKQWHVRLVGLASIEWDGCPSGFGNKYKSFCWPLSLRGHHKEVKGNDLLEVRHRSRKQGCENILWRRSKSCFMVKNWKQRQRRCLNFFLQTTLIFLYWSIMMESVQSWPSSTVVHHFLSPAEILLSQQTTPYKISDTTKWLKKKKKKKVLGSDPCTQKVSLAGRACSSPSLLQWCCQTSTASLLQWIPGYLWESMSLPWTFIHVGVK